MITTTINSDPSQYTNTPDDVTLSQQGPTATTPRVQTAQVDRVDAADNDQAEPRDGNWAEGDIARAAARTFSTDTVTQEESDDGDDDDNRLEKVTSQSREVWKFRMRPPDDEEPEGWWFASTAIPLLAATTGPLANVLSIAALVVWWRETYDPDYPGVDDMANGYRDPNWCTVLNAVSLACGFAGNLFLLFNFTRFVRYIYALPLTIILWFMASGILITITTCLHVYVPPEWPEATYSQGFWHAVIAAVLYLISALLLMINMLGYFLGHYTQHFELTDEQRNLILQTMMFFFWLAGGGAVFMRTSEDWNYVDALYFCDVTVLTVGFGDFAAQNDVSRGLVFPYSVGGIIMLGLMASSIRNFAIELSQDKIVKNHVERRRQRTMERSVSTSFEAERQNALENTAPRGTNGGQDIPTISAPFDPMQRTITFDDAPTQEPPGEQRGFTAPRKQKKKRKRGTSISSLPGLKKTMSWASEKLPGSSNNGLFRTASSKGRLLVLREEKDRFMAMRAIQYNTRRFKRYFALSMSVIAFALLWFVGAAVFYVCEQRTQGLSYFEALYFCYVSLLTIGYGDLSPKSNAGKPFFIVWSLIAVPTMTILISDMSDTVVAAYKRGTFTLAAWTVLPTKGFFREFLDNHVWVMALFRKVQGLANARASRKRVEKGFGVGPESGDEAAARTAAGEGIGDDPCDGPTLEELAAEDGDDGPDEHDLARRLALAIRRTADHLKEGSDRRYTYEEWVEYTRLIRFSAGGGSGSGSGSSLVEDDEEGADSRGIVTWDWIGPKSPMMSDQSEAEWVLDRLCESLDRYMQRQLPSDVRQRHREKEAAILRRRTAPRPSQDSDRSPMRPPLGSPRTATTDGSPDSPRTRRRVASPTFARRRSLGGGLGLLAEMEEDERQLRRNSAGGTSANSRSAERGRDWYRRRSSDLGRDTLDVPGGAAKMLGKWRERVLPTTRAERDAMAAAPRRRADNEAAPPPFANVVQEHPKLTEGRRAERRRRAEVLEELRLENEQAKAKQVEREAQEHGRAQAGTAGAQGVGVEGAGAST